MVFDLMGTCADWHTSIVKALDSKASTGLAVLNYSQVAKDWRVGFFHGIYSSFQCGERSPDIDDMHRIVLDRILEERAVDCEEWNRDVRADLVDAWYHQLGQLKVDPLMILSCCSLARRGRTHQTAETEDGFVSDDFFRFVSQASVKNSP